MGKTAIIIPACSDYNRGDQALVLETRKIISKALGIQEVYMMSMEDTTQCNQMGIKTVKDILKHPSRYDKKKKNIKYGIGLKIRWGIVAILDYIFSLFMLNNVTRKILKKIVPTELKTSIDIFENTQVCFVKGGGFLHDYTGGIVGVYTMYYLLFHIKLALKMKKPVYIMPNSYGPFKSKKTAKMVNKILNKCEIVTARESISASEQTNGLQRPIELFPDLAFFLEQTKQDNIKEYLQKYEINENDKYVAITVRPYRFYNADNPSQKYENYKKAFVKFIEYLEQKNYIPLLVVHTRSDNEHENDEICIREIEQMLKKNSKAMIIKEDNLNCKDLKAIYSLCDFVVGTRFHSVIFSLQNQIPCIAITYGGNKGEGIMKDIGLDEFTVKIQELSFEKLQEKFENMETQREIIKQKIQIYLKKADDKYKRLIQEIEKNGSK